MALRSRSPTWLETTASGSVSTGHGLGMPAAVWACPRACSRRDAPATACILATPACCLQTRTGPLLPANSPRLHAACSPEGQQRQHLAHVSVTCRPTCHAAALASCRARIHKAFLLLWPLDAGRSVAAVIAFHLLVPPPCNSLCAGTPTPLMA